MSKKLIKRHLVENMLFHLEANLIKKFFFFFNIHIKSRFVLEIDHLSSGLCLGPASS